MANNELAAVILAAGLGTRMKSKKAKVLCEIKGIPMVLHSVKVAVDIAGSNTIVVVGYQAENVKKIVSEVFNVKFAYQEKQIGTGNAALCAIPFLSNNIKNVIILCGDVPLLSSKTIRRLTEYHKSNRNDISVLGVDIPNPTGYGRIIIDCNGHINRIVEEADANEKEKKNTLINAGIFCVRYSWIEIILRKIKRDNSKNEMYLTDIIKIGHNHNLKIGVYISSNTSEIIGINTPKELAKAEIITNSSMLN